ncbi:MAG: zinc ribbon domain-containing protein [Chloroflexaceae bacterium]|nr:zinc ribbon domain-containing protein [Chloroflexaceae bacterium]NJO05844.1 zinc ribbon domain-containing protein [Chloroflexaceae bacterium]
MPIYEYGCKQCNGHFQKLVQGFSDPIGLTCPRCGSTHLQRLVSRFATVKSEEARIDALADPSTFAGLDENDPRSVAQWARKLGKELGDEAGDDWNEMVDEMLEAELNGNDDDTKPGAGSRSGDNLGWG